jgi:hypothetical protein
MAVAARGQVEVLGWQVLLSQLVIVTITVVYSWFAHRGFPFGRSPAEVGLPEHREAVS